MSVLWKLALVAGLVSVGIAFCGFYKVLNEFHKALNYADRVSETVDKNALRLFKNFDHDEDGYLDIFEFQAASDYLIKKGSVEETNPDKVVSKKLIKERLLNGTVQLDEEFVTLRTNFKPLDMTSMSLLSIGGRGEEIDWTSDIHLQGLKNWIEPFINEMNVTSQDLRIFLPAGAKSVGEAWDVVLPLTSKYEPSLSHNRYEQDPPMSEKEEVLTNLLTMFAPRPFILNRFAPQGTMAVLRAVNNNYVDIIFRIHAEFQINEPPNFPFWFTPAQFTGNIVISKDGTHVEHFALFVPNDKKLNVDMEWVTGKRKVTDQSKDQFDMEVDIGFLPEMSLVVDGPSRKPGEKVREKGNIVWDKEIAESSAKRILQQKFYPFQEVEYLPFNKTYEKAQAENKLVHQIILWGSLDDQSC